MRVIVVGCGRVGSTLAYQLHKQGYQVTVIDKDASTFDNLPANFHGRTILGDVLARDVLHRAEIEEADALAAVTDSDSINALIAYIAKAEYQVSRVVARNYNPRQRSFQEALGIPVVGSAFWGSQRIIEELLSDASLRVVLFDSNAKFVVYQLKVPENWQGGSLRELLPEDRGKVLAWTRAGQPLEVSSTQSLEMGDLIYLGANAEEIEALRHRLGLHQERFA